MRTQALSLILFWLQSAQSIPWWQKVTGILAIPAAVLGIIYVVYQIKKTRSETLKQAEQRAPKEKTIADAVEPATPGIVVGKGVVSKKAEIEMTGAEIQGSSPIKIPSLDVGSGAQVQGGKAIFTGLRQTSPEPKDK